MTKKKLGCLTTAMRIRGPNEWAPLPSHETERMEHRKKLSMRGDTLSCVCVCVCVSSSCQKKEMLGDGKPNVRPDSFTIQFLSVWQILINGLRLHDLVRSTWGSHPGELLEGKAAGLTQTLLGSRWGPMLFAVIVLLLHHEILRGWLWSFLLLEWEN